MIKEYTNSKLEQNWLVNAKKKHKCIVLPEAYFSQRVVNAGIDCAKIGLCDIIFLTDDEKKLEMYNLSTYKCIKVINIKTNEIREVLQNALYIKRKEKGITFEDAGKLLENSVYFGTLMVDLDMADGLVSGAEISTAETFKPAFQIIKGKTKETKISSFFVMIKDEKQFVLADCGVNINPTAEEISQIAKDSANSCRQIVGVEPKVALLSYSTLGSAEGESAIKMRDAKKLLDAQSLDFKYDGELQFDSATVESVAKLKCKNSIIQGDANVLIFPDLQSGNIGYKIMQRCGNFMAYGPIAQGMRKPINDVSRGATVKDIVMAIAITILQTN